MKGTLIGVALATIILLHVTSLPVPTQSNSRRTFGNFVPNPKQSFQIFDGTGRPAILSGDIDKIEAATALFEKQTGHKSDGIRISSSYTSEHNGVTHVYLQQVLNGLSVANGYANLNILKGGHVHSIGNSFYTAPDDSVAEIKPKVLAEDALEAFATLLKLDPSGAVAETTTDKGVVFHGLNFATADVPAKLAYLQTNEGKTLRLVWDLDVLMELNHYKVYVDAETNVVLGLADYITDATYNVFPVGLNDPRDGERQLVENPQHLAASPLGWHATNENEPRTDTVGNNVQAQESRSGGMGVRPSGGEDLFFDSPLDLDLDPVGYANASTTQLFYMTNIIHDIFYMYGFNEVSGNFQDNNFDLGGAGGDSMDAHAQYNAANFPGNNAFFSPAVDGEKSSISMMTFDPFTPHRDSDFDNAIIVHEYAHGISIRLTGGPMSIDCLWSGEGGGMGEGWGDILGVILQTNADTTRNANYNIGSYLGLDPHGNGGFRHYHYSTDFSVNPSTYNYVVREGYNGPHAKGEVWAVILYEVYWNLVEKHGFDPDWYNTNPENNPNGLGGNVIFVQLLIDGMKLQPCQPNFIQARDAIIEADRINNNGANFEELWRGFAKRGLGVNAEFEGVEDFEVPSTLKN